MKTLVFWILIGVAIVPVMGEEEEYLATAITEVGDFPLPEKVDNLATKIAKHLVQFKWGAYTGSRTRVTVLEVENDSPVPSYNPRLGGVGGHYEFSSQDTDKLVPVQGIESLITDALFQTGRFTVLERERLTDQFEEQDLGRSGRISKPSAAKTGKTLGSEVNIKLKITGYEPEASGKKVGLKGVGRGIINPKVGKSSSSVTIVFQLIDVNTSEILFSKKVKSVVSKKSFSLGAGANGLGGAFSSFSKTPIGLAMIAAINMGTFELVKQIGNSPAKGQVISVETDLVALNIGANKGLEEGDQLQAKSKGKEMIDPETGLSLGSRTRKVGTLQVVEVQEKFCLAEPMGFDASRLKPGDVAIANKKPAQLRFAEMWMGPKGKKLEKKKRRNQKKYGKKN